MYNSFFLANLCTIRRNLKNQHEGIRSVSERLHTLEQTQEKMYDLLRDIKDDMNNMGKMVSRDSLDISSFFPITDDEKLAQFLRKDADYSKRIEMFDDMLFTHCNANFQVKIKKSTFRENLLRSLFSRLYLTSHRWPTVK